MTKQITLITSALCLAALFGCSGGAGGDDSSPCGKAAGPLSGIVVLEVKDSGADPSIMKTYKSELAAECTAKKLEETAKEALDCYDKNKSERGYFIFKKCPEEPGKALVAAVVAKHGGKKAE